jgi:Inhibitor of vertebrate lysozyme (Ivy)
MRKFFALATLALTWTSLPALAKDEYLFDVMKNQTFRQAWVAMLQSSKDLPRWLGEITGHNNYVATPGMRTTIGGAAYRAFHACEAHNCGDSQFEVIFLPDGSRAYGMFVENGKPPRWFGAPDDAIKAALAKAISE